MSNFKVGEKVLVSPQVTGNSDWVEAIIIKIEENRFIGTVINVETEDGNIFFDREYLFKHLNEKELCLQ